MNGRDVWRAAGLVFAVLISAAAGCGRTGGDEVRGAVVTGRLLDHGHPLKFLPNEQVQVTFAAKGRDGVSALAEVDPATGTFTVRGPSGQGLPPGAYRIGLASEVYGGDGKNRFEQSFNAEVTPLAADVGPEEGQSFDVDVGTKRVTKK